MKQRRGDREKKVKRILWKKIYKDLAHELYKKPYNEEKNEKK